MCYLKLHKERGYSGEIELLRAGGLEPSHSFIDSCAPAKTGLWRRGHLSYREGLSGSALPKGFVHSETLKIHIQPREQSEWRYVRILCVYIKASAHLVPEKETSIGGT